MSERKYVVKINDGRTTMNEYSDLPALSETDKVEVVEVHDGAGVSKRKALETAAAVLQWSAATHKRNFESCMDRAMRFNLQAVKEA